MRCVVSTCKHDSSSILSQGITFYTFPLEPSECEIWLKALDKEGWRPKEDSAVCSSHFFINDLYLTTGGFCKLRDGAIPKIVKQNELKDNNLKRPCDLKICRICFATDVNIYSMNLFKSLCLAYETLTGFSIENESNMPPYLCSECSHQLMNCISFRSKILQSHMTLEDILKKNNCITLETIKSFGTKQSQDNPGLGTSGKKYQCNIEIECVKNENVGLEELICPDLPPSFEHFILDGIKKEKDDELDQNSENNEDISHDIVYSPILHKYIVRDSVKMEREDEYSTNSNDQDMTNYDMEQRNGLVDDDFSMDVGHPAQEEEEIANHTVKTLKNKKLSKNSKQPQINVPSKSMETGVNAMLNDKLPLDDRATESAEKPFPCTICNKSFSQKSWLMNHLRIHSGEKPYSCDICKKTFNDKSNHRKHLRIHSGEKPYPCPYCEKTFNRKNYLENHLRTHSGEKPYSCGICNKVFGHKHHLKSHLRIHSGEKPYSCHICHKEFSEKSNLHMHLKVHSGDKLYSCSECNVAFSTKYLLKCHSKVHSGNSIESLKSLTPDSGLQITIQNITSK